jgi:hypothetical protein
LTTGHLVENCPLEEIIPASYFLFKNINNLTIICHNFSDRVDLHRKIYEGLVTIEDTIDTKWNSTNIYQMKWFSRELNNPATLSVC